MIKLTGWLLLRQVLVGQMIYQLPPIEAVIQDKYTSHSHLLVMSNYLLSHLDHG